jgi:hypothetical protein
LKSFEKKEEESKEKLAETGHLADKARELQDELS